VIRSLRKGSTSIEVSYKFGEESIGASNAEIELMDDHAVFRVKISPCGGNEAEDARSVFSDYPHTITNVVIRDEQVRKKTDEFLGAYAERIGSVRLELLHHKKFKFHTCLKLLDQDGLAFEIET